MAQVASKTAQDGLEDGPRWPLDGLRSPQDVPRWLLEDPQGPEAPQSPFPPSPGRPETPSPEPPGPRQHGGTCRRQLDFQGNRDAQGAPRTTSAPFRTRGAAPPDRDRPWPCSPPSTRLHELLAVGLATARRPGPPAASAVLVPLPLPLSSPFFVLLLTASCPAAWSAPTETVFPWAQATGEHEARSILSSIACPC